MCQSLGIVRMRERSLITTRRPRLLLTMTSLIVIALIYGAPWSDVDAEEQLSFDAHVMEFHPGIADTEVIAVFPFTNMGMSPITISEITTSCGCTTAVNDKEVYEVGQHGTITTKFQVGDRLGLEIKTFTVKTKDDHATGQSPLTMKIFIPEGPAISPKISTWEVGSTATGKTVTIKIPQDSDYVVNSIISNDPHFDAKLIPGQDNHTCSILLTPQATDKPYTESIEVVTNHRIFHIFARIVKKPE
jgi:hypothetical protein